MPGLFLRSARLGFRTWSGEDLPLARRLWGDPRVTRLIGGPFPDHRVRERLATEIALQTRHGYQYWPVFRLADSGFAGCAGLRPYPARAELLELGAHLLPEAWGQGLGSEAATTVMQYAFGTLRVAGLFAGHHPDNHNSRRLLARLGFRYRHDDYYAPTGLQHPSYLLLAEEFARLGKPDPGPAEDRRWAGCRTCP